MLTFPFPAPIVVGGNPPEHSAGTQFHSLGRKEAIGPFIFGAVLNAIQLQSRIVLRAPLETVFRNESGAEIFPRFSALGETNRVIYAQENTIEIQVGEPSLVRFSNVSFETLGVIPPLVVLGLPRCDSECLEPLENGA